MPHDKPVQHQQWNSKFGPWKTASSDIRLVVLKWSHTENGLMAELKLWWTIQMRKQDCRQQRISTSYLMASFQHMKFDDVSQPARWILMLLKKCAPDCGWWLDTRCPFESVRELSSLPVSVECESCYADHLVQCWSLYCLSNNAEVQTCQLQYRCVRESLVLL